MKKRTKIILIILLCMVVFLAYFGYSAYKMVLGSEELTGNLDKIPTTESEKPPVTKDSADWPNWRCMNFDGKNNTKNIIADWSKGLEILWQVNYLCQGKATAAWSTPVVQGNRLIVPGRDEKNDLVFCINSDNGKLIWFGSYPAEANTSHGPGARATPFISDNKVFTFGRSGILACWNLEDGKLIWKNNVNDFGGKEPQWGHTSSILVYQNKVIVQGGGNALVIAFDKNSGKVIWKSLDGDAGYSFSMPVKIDTLDRLLVFHAKALSCLNFDNGKELWNVPWETKYGVNATTPIVEHDIVFITSGYGMGCQAIKVKKDGYDVLWKSDVMASQHSDPVLIDGFLYGYSGESSQNKGAFVCVELKTGKEMWRTNEIGWGTTVFADNYLICLDIKGNLFLVKPDSKKFEKITEIKSAIKNVTHPAWTSPIVANGKLYLRYLQQLVCYKITK